MKQLLMILSVTLLMSACSAGAENGRPAMPPMALPTLTVDTVSLVDYTKYPASVEGVSNININAKVSGYINQVLVDEGERVKKGQSLFKLETQSFNQQANAAKAMVSAAQVEVDRLKPLVKEEIVSAIQLKTAEAKLESAKSNLAAIRANIAYCNITAPVDGVVNEIRFREGSLVGPMTAKLTTVSNIDQVYVYFAMNEKAFLQFIKDAEGENVTDKIEHLPKVKLLLADDTTYPYEGKIETITGSIDKMTGAVQFRAVFPNPDHILRNGSSGQVMVPKEYHQVMVIPAMSISELQDRKMVYAVAPNDSVFVKYIKVEAIVNNRAVVNAGLKRHDKIVGQGVGKLRPGMTIKPIPSTTDKVVNSFSTYFK